MAQDAASRLFVSVPRTRLMRLFLFSPKVQFSVLDIVSRTHFTSNEIRREVKLLREAGIIRISRSKKTRCSLNERYPYILELRHVLLDAVLSKRSLLERLRRTGVVRFLAVSGIFIGDFDRRLDVIIVGDRISDMRLRSAIRTLEKDIGTELRFASLPTQDFLYRLTISDRFLRNFLDYPHHTVLDRLGIELTP